MTASTPQPHLAGGSDADADHHADETAPHEVARGLLVTEKDHELLERARTLMQVLNEGAIACLPHVRDPGRFAQDLDDLGWVLADIGNDMQARADELRQAAR